MQGVLKARGRRGEDCLLREDSGIRANNRSFLHTLTTTKKGYTMVSLLPALGCGARVCTRPLPKTLRSFPGPPLSSLTLVLKCAIQPGEYSSHRTEDSEADPSPLGALQA